MKTLAMMKMEKNFVALEKGYPRKPYKKHSMARLLGRLDEEVEELKRAIRVRNRENSKQECADVSNIIDYIFERLESGTEVK